MMTEANKDSVLEIDLDAPDANKPADKKTDKVETKTTDTPPVDEALEALKKQLADEKAARERAEARATTAEDTARQASDTATKSQTDIRSANLTMVTNAIDSVKREQEILEANYANAMTAQDFAGAAKIQTAISTAAAKLVQLETGKQAMEEEAKQPIRRMDPPKDPVEALASQLSPRSAQWVRAHPEYARDPRLTQKMVAAHNLVVSDVAADTDDYFDRVEKLLGIKRTDATAENDDTGALSAAAETVQRRSAPPAAPVTRSGTPNGKRPNTVQLTAAEVEIAEATGMTPREYAENKAKLIKDGRLH